ncbi:MAG: N-acetyl-1-D-myo-inositol-2-amino-2-deoxy-alpha-D-glucopyranoside deacetylase [Micrococcales bacterium]|nr:N-acetyl-1-D-myo-inositol-2-amino-2-deoxy-alpha-D-glucopyranoside deacetylase [Micrococcales bacterium]
MKLLFVHAHPDDESLWTGLAIAHFARAGDEVHVLTCTLGEEGEVIPPELAHLAPDRDDALGPHRREELRDAMTAIGASYEVLGELGGRAYRDSGMAGSPAASHEQAWVGADPDEAALQVAEVIQRVEPALVVTYDASGGYGHPDHVQTHQVVRAALAVLPDEGRPSLYAVVTPRSWAEADRAWLAANLAPGLGWHIPAADAAYEPSVVPDEEVTHEVVDQSALPRQILALDAHRTQVQLTGGAYALSNRIAHRLSGREAYQQLDPATGEVLRHEGPPRPLGEHERALGEPAGDA